MSREDCPTWDVFDGTVGTVGTVAGAAKPPPVTSALCYPRSPEEACSGNVCNDDSHLLGDTVSI